jgi:hypothetical protein
VRLWFASRRKRLGWLIADERASLDGGGDEILIFGRAYDILSTSSPCFSTPAMHSPTKYGGTASPNRQKTRLPYNG